jgi:hypothetical protein
MLPPTCRRAFANAFLYTSERLPLIAYLNVCGTHLYCQCPSTMVDKSTFCSTCAHSVSAENNLSVLCGCSDFRRTCPPRPQMCMCVSMYLCVCVCLCICASHSPSVNLQYVRMYLHAYICLIFKSLIFKSRKSPPKSDYSKKCTCSHKT